MSAAPLEPAAVVAVRAAMGKFVKNLRQRRVRRDVVGHVVTRGMHWFAFKGGKWSCSGTPKLWYIDDGSEETCGGWRRGEHKDVCVALPALVLLGLVTAEDAGQCLEWARAAIDERDRKKQTRKLEREAADLGYRVVKIKEKKR